MKKNKMRHYETLNGDLFPQDSPKAKMVGKQNRKNEIQNCDEPRMDYGTEPQQPTLDEIWEWLGNPDEY